MVFGVEDLGRPVADQIAELGVDHALIERGAVGVLVIHRCIRLGEPLDLPIPFQRDVGIAFQQGVVVLHQIMDQRRRQRADIGDRGVQALRAGVKP